MAAPVALVRGVPAGFFLRNGYQALITLKANPTVSFWEKDVKPFDADLGEPVDLTTQHNRLVMTFAPRALIKIGDVTTNASYDPAILTQIYALMGIETTITIQFPNLSSWAAFGFLKKFEPSDMKHGEQPMAAVTFSITNRDPALAAMARDAVPLGEFGLGTGTAYVSNEQKPVYAAGPLF